jgi:hypothetical protein
MVQINPEEHCPHIGFRHDMCSDDFCYNPGDPSLIHTEPDEELKVLISKHNATVSDDLDKGIWSFPNIC